MTDRMARADGAVQMDEGFLGYAGERTHVSEARWGVHDTAIRIL